MQDKRTLWKSRFGFIMATTGAAVGLGNIWRFPYMAGDNGGSAFVMLYLLFVLVIGLPCLIAEVLIGRMGGKNPITSLLDLCRSYHLSKGWAIMGWLGALTLSMVLGFYSVVSGWSLIYLKYALSGEFNQSTQQSILTLWETTLANPGLMMIYHGVFMLVTMLVISFGITKGIERSTKIMMPALFTLLIGLVIYNVFQPGFHQSIVFLFEPDLSKINLQVVISALGQAFFTLALGATCMMAYGAYLPRSTPIPSTLTLVTTINIAVALLAGLAIFPLVFTYGLSPEAGPGLMYKVLPMAFSQMPGSTIIGSCFFILLFFAAWTSSLSMAEPLVMILVERFKCSRIISSTLVGLVCWLIGLGTLFSFNLLQGVELSPEWPLMRILMDVPSDIFLPIGGLLVAIFAGYKIPKTVLFEQDLFKSRRLTTLWYWILKTIVPAGILVVLFKAFV